MIYYKSLKISLVLMWIAFGAPAQNRIFLSGSDAAHAELWDFMISTGRNSGYWTKIPVPSNWELQGFGYYTYGKDHKRHHEDPEIGYYKKDFFVENISGRRYRLTFEGVMTDTHVKINGKKARAVHQGGFTRFHYEITDLIREGKNTLEVEVHKSSAHASVQKSERNADYWLFGGIYRPVYIDVLPMEYIERVAIDAKMDGTFHADVYANGILEDVKIEARVLSSDDRTIDNPLNAVAGRGDTVVAISGSFSGIRPWSHEYPHLYKLVVDLKKDGRVVHSYSQKFGFRTFEVRDHDGFYLNGRRILLKGANMHSFRPGSGRALSRRDIEENFRLLKELNFNCVRPCHYPPDPWFFDLCDSLGLLAMDELPGWHAPLQTDIGAKLVKELVIRDVNHPSIILWGNGNHVSHNPELDEHFFKWDIQKRRPLKNAAKKEDVFKNYSPSFDIVDTRFYPSYDNLIDRLNGEHIVLPNEALHALYDGGGAAGLKDYWDAFKASKVGGGLMIWALFDECVIRSDEGFRLDCQQNKAPDGLVGPHGEKEGSYYAVREIWSPVQVDSPVLDANFDGTLGIHNDFAFVNLKECRFESSLVNFTGPNAAATGHHDYRISMAVDNVPAGEKGKIKINLPHDWKSYDALQLTAWDNWGHEVNKWTWPIGMRTGLPSQFVGATKKQLSQDPDDPFLVLVGNTRFRFDAATGTLTEVMVGNRKFPIGATPFLVYRAEKNSSLATSEGSVNIRKNGDAIVVESHHINGFDHLTWTVRPEGYLTLDYAYTLPEGAYYYAGVGLRVIDGSILGRGGWEKDHQEYGKIGLKGAY